MQPHQQRVVDEANELNDKREKLSAFISGNPIFSGLDMVQQGLMKTQLHAMTAYLEVLNLRISYF